MLLQRPKPQADESLESYLIRVANNNGYENINRFLVALKHYLCHIDSKRFTTFPTDIRQINPSSSQRSSAARSHALQYISQLTFTETADLLRLAISRSPLKFSPSTTSVIRAGEILPKSLIRTKHIPCCSSCLIEQGYANYLWHFEGYDCCHIHQKLLTFRCECGEPYDYRINGLSLQCSSCGTTITQSKNEPEIDSLEISLWLAGETIKWLPELPASYRWGTIHWWMRNQNTEVLETCSFSTFWRQWPESFHNLIEQTLSHNQEYSLQAPQEWRLKDLIGELLFGAINLPRRNLQYNLILRELFYYLESHLWENNGLIANLKLNALEAALVLNCDIEQLASMVEQGLLVAMRHQKHDEPLSYTNYLFHFGDIFCLWLAEFQTDEFNRSFYTSRW
ncbi:TniQ family protein [Vibrio fluvialis]|uniref:TniQ domain-containing protein n=1 Tax=Vibrio fluvialis TaxID=676 RepID=A0AAX2LSX7_VIBFL|nr:TniQ family protein [Vibrio fluvialis]AMF93042.1 hypothetical protein AL536_06190 [Vibrio fluvialis]EKO4009712.1 hypothetical protein [Vibrio fluvialis]MBL4306390.1 TniQ family protein [Vibrio fluvialis]MBY7861977.1 TniQ family protein [Vibrio fluvialis]MBY8228018.1 TniQ family protein [Vibrio fluvialis]